MVDVWRGADILASLRTVFVSRELQRSYELGGFGDRASYGLGLLKRSLAL